ncbi:hypothetical protein [Empedobacter sp. R132-2]|uniref:hypothetical protein n=1 Tax=Empedobacter sp. R132-2 TaxID=2746740 RepID=UPI0025779816|nr:hypothetical protein [Empedobacter sp. R132-2]MDM1137827.1 hypothetical protein [Empedobacter sp. R132-2]
MVKENNSIAFIDKIFEITNEYKNIKFNRNRSIHIKTQFIDNQNSISSYLNENIDLKELVDSFEKLKKKYKSNEELQKIKTEYYRFKNELRNINNVNNIVEEYVEFNVRYSNNKFYREFLNKLKTLDNYITKNKDFQNLLKDHERIKIESDDYIDLFQNKKLYNDNFESLLKFEFLIELSNITKIYHENYIISEDLMEKELLYREKLKKHQEEINVILEEEEEDLDASLNEELFELISSIFYDSMITFEFDGFEIEENENDSERLNYQKAIFLLMLKHYKLEEDFVYESCISLINLCFNDNINESTGLTNNSFDIIKYLASFLYNSNKKNNNANVFIGNEVSNNEFDYIKLLTDLYFYLIDIIETYSYKKNPSNDYIIRLIEILAEVNHYIIPYKIIKLKKINDIRNRIIANLGDPKVLIFHYINNLTIDPKFKSTRPKKTPELFTNESVIKLYNKRNRITKSNLSPKLLGYLWIKLNSSIPKYTDEKQQNNLIALSLSVITGHDLETINKNYIKNEIILSDPEKNKIKNFLEKIIE